RARAQLISEIALAKRTDEAAAEVTLDEVLAS
ncbi:MAG: CarD family transcriptional regulator, partial [Actinobacteria bacterium]|nr:CarD family transcriptional regulator [Actinomycetota bacterium]